MQIERITVGRVRSIPGEYGNRKMELTATVEPGEEPRAVALEMAAFIDRELIAAEEQEKLIQQEERQRYEDERKARIENRKLEDKRLYLTPTVRIHQRAKKEWLVLQELDWPINNINALTRAGEWIEWCSVSETRLPEVLFPTEDEARQVFSEHPAEEPTKEQMEIHDAFADQ